MARREWFDYPSTASPLSAALLNDLEARKPEADELWVNVKAPPYEAVGDGLIDDVLAVQEAIDAVEAAGGGTVYFPTGQYLISAAGLTVTGNSVRLMGAGRTATILVTASFDLLTLSAPSDVINYFHAEGMLLQSNVGGGHVIKCVGSVVASSFVDCKLKQHNDAKSLCYQVDAGHWIDNLIDNCELEHTLAASVPSWYFNTSSATLANCNSNTWRRLICRNSGIWFFHIETTASASAWNYDNNFRDITWEVTNGGCIKLMGAHNSVIESCNVFDLSASTTQDLYYIGKSGAGSRCHHITFRNVSRRGGTLGGGKKDIHINDAFFTMIDNCGATSGFTLELAGNPYVTLLGLADTATVQNVGSYTNHLSPHEHRFGGGSQTVASATNITLGPAPLVNVTGVTTITSVTASWPGRMVTLVFAGILTFTNGSNLKLSANFVTSALDSISLICDGTNWYEMSRSVNV